MDGVWLGDSGGIGEDLGILGKDGIKDEPVIGIVVGSLVRARVGTNVDVGLGSGMARLKDLISIR